MATIPGSQLFDVNNTTPSTINIVETADGTPPNPGSNGDFNLEVYMGTYGSQPAIAAGYQGSVSQN